MMVLEVIILGTRYTWLILTNTGKNNIIFNKQTSGENFRLKNWV